MEADAHQVEDKGDNANAACRGSATMHARTTISNGVFEAAPENTTIK